MPKPIWKLLPTTLLILACGWLQAGPSPATSSPAQYLSDHAEWLLDSQQAWGELGWDTAAHQAGQGGAPLQIGTHSYPKGLGHHASGTITVALDGRFAAFDAQVGLQPCGGDGSVIFRVLVDGVPRFESGVLRATNPPCLVHVSVAGAQELRLEANDAGDGITCDMANWAEARLTPAVGQAARAFPAVDMAPFARVVTWDSHRLDGARASRVEEFRAEDLFLETELPREADGCYRVPVSADGLGCIGLQWLNRRALKRLTLEFPPGVKVPATNAVQVQGWFGESAWQGAWKALPGEWQAEGNRLAFELSPKAGAGQTQKVRWIFPNAAQTRLRGLSAFTRSRWETVRLRVEVEGAARRARGEIFVFNGEVLRLDQRTNLGGAHPSSGPATVASRPAPECASDSVHSGPAAPEDGRAPEPRQVWNLQHPLAFEVRYSRPSSFKADLTVLQFHLPAGEVSVAVEDVLSNECVYLPDFGLFVSRDPAPVTLAEYKQRIATRQTIPQQVRALPDQTLAQAMARTHHEAQQEGPVMLSLACDNTKFVLERDGTLRVPAPGAKDDWLGGAAELRPRFGTGAADRLSRALEGGWLPIPVITLSKGGLVWRERVFVAPADEPAGNSARFSRPAVCVAEFTVSNSQPVAASAELTLDFIANSGKNQPAALPAEPGTALQLGPELKGILRVSEHCPLRFQVTGGKAGLLGTLPPGGTAGLTVCLADARVELSLLVAQPERLREATVAYWNAVLAPTMQVETPEPLLNDLIRSSQVRCLIAARNEAGGARIAPWIAAMSYGPLESEANSVIRGMAFMGHEEFARRSLEFFIHRYNTNGFLTTGYTTFGTPWHLWTLSEYQQLYQEKEWLRGVAPEISRVGDWLVRQTEKTRHNGAGGAPVPESGLMPPGVLADWNAFAFHYTMNAYCYAALRGLGTMLAELPKAESRMPGSGARPSPGAATAASQPVPESTSASVPSGLAAPEDGRAPVAGPSGARFAAAAEKLRGNILRAYRWTQAQSPALPLRNGTWVPHYPSQVHSPGKLADFFPGQDGGRSWCYDVEVGAHQLVPTGVLDPRGREAERILEHMEDVQFLSEGWFDYPAAASAQDWFNLGGFSKVQPYYTRNCEAYALRDDVKPFIRSYFNTLAALLNPEVMTFWEHFHHCGAWDKTHETGYFLRQTRTMLVLERGDQLWLAPLITTNWLADGKRLAVSNAPTRFGPVSYCVESRATQGQVTATIHPSGRQPPAEIVLRLPHPEGWPMRSVRVNGKRISTLDKSEALVRLKPKPAVLEVQVFYEKP